MSKFGEFDDFQIEANKETHLRSKNTKKNNYFSKFQKWNIQITTILFEPFYKILIESWKTIGNGSGERNLESRLPIVLANRVV